MFQWTEEAQETDLHHREEITKRRYQMNIAVYLILSYFVGNINPAYIISTFSYPVPYAPKITILNISA